MLLALAGVRLRRQGDDLGVVFLVDDSASVSPGAREAARRFVENSLHTAAPTMRLASWASRGG